LRLLDDAGIGLERWLKIIKISKSTPKIFFAYDN